MIDWRTLEAELTDIARRRGCYIKHAQMHVAAGGYEDWWACSREGHKVLNLTEVAKELADILERRSK